MKSHNDESEEMYQARIRAIRKYRAAVRRDWFRRQALLKRWLRAVDAGDFSPALKPEKNIAGSSGVALATSRGNEVTALTGSPALPPGVNNTISGLKTMHESDDEIKGQIDRLPSSSGCDMPTGITTNDQALDPGQEQKPALTDRKDE